MDKNDVDQLNIMPEEKDLPFLHRNSQSVLQRALVFPNRVEMLGVVTTVWDVFANRNAFYSVYKWNLRDADKTRTHLFTIKRPSGARVFLSPTHIVLALSADRCGSLLTGKFECWKVEQALSPEPISSHTISNCRAVTRSMLGELVILDSSLKLDILDMQLKIKHRAQLIGECSEWINVHLISGNRLVITLMNSFGNIQKKFRLKDNNSEYILLDEIDGRKISDDILEIESSRYFPSLINIKSPDGDVCRAEIKNNKIFIDAYNEERTLIARKKMPFHHNNFVITDHPYFHCLIPKEPGDQSSLLVCSTGEIRGVNHWLQRVSEKIPIISRFIEDTGVLLSPLARIVADYVGIDVTQIEEEVVSSAELRLFIKDFINYLDSSENFPKIRDSLIRFFPGFWDAKYEQRRGKLVEDLNSLLRKLPTSMNTTIKESKDLEKNLLALINKFINALKSDETHDESAPKYIQSLKRFLFNQEDIVLAALSIDDLRYRIHHHETTSPRKNPIP